VVLSSESAPEWLSLARIPSSPLSSVPINPLALKLDRGGKKNLPIADFLLDDEESDVRKVALARLLVSDPTHRKQRASRRNQNSSSSEEAGAYVALSLLWCHADEPAHRQWPS
jgi:hypothetical protein